MLPGLNAMFHGRCHKKAVIHVLFHAGIALVPLAAVVVMFLYDDWKPMFFVENGEFYIYSVVFLTMALYALASLGLKKDDLGILFIVATIFILIASLVLYGSLIHDKIGAAGPTDSAAGPSTNATSASYTPSSNQAGADALSSHALNGQPKASSTTGTTDARSAGGFTRSSLRPDGWCGARGS
jgi:hypothetical protein